MISHAMICDNPQEGGAEGAGSHRAFEAHPDVPLPFAGACIHLRIVLFSSYVFLSCSYFMLFLLKAKAKQKLSAPSQSKELPHSATGLS